jgi:hypothetical protein
VNFATVYGKETFGFLIPGEEYKLLVFNIKMIGKIFGPKQGKVI